MEDSLKELLVESLPKLSQDDIRNLSKKLVARSLHDKRVREQEKTISDLRKMVTDTNNSFMVSLGLQQKMQDQINDLERKLEHKSAEMKSEPEAEEEDSGCFTVMLDRAQQELTELRSEIRDREVSIKQLQGQIAAATKSIHSIKRQLGLPADATMEQVEAKVRGQTSEIKSLKANLRRELEKCRKYERTLADEKRRKEHLQLTLQHKEVHFRFMTQVRAPILMTGGVGGQDGVWKDLAPKPCANKSCSKPVQPEALLFCDECNMTRLSVSARGLQRAQRK